MIYDSVVKTGNHILDTVLTGKSLLCEARGVTLTCVADGDLPGTSKEDVGYHGFGLKSIRYTAEKYGGFLTVQNDDEIFLFRVTIPIHQS